MAIDVAFSFLKNVIDKKAGSQTRIPHSESTREETIIIELTVSFSNFSSKTISPSCQSSTRQIVVTSF